MSDGSSSSGSIPEQDTVQFYDCDGKPVYRAEMLTLSAALSTAEAMVKKIPLNDARLLVGQHGLWLISDVGKWQINKAGHVLSFIIKGDPSPK